MRKGFAADLFRLSGTTISGLQCGAVQGSSTTASVTRGPIPQYQLQLMSEAGYRRAEIDQVTAVRLSEDGQVPASVSVANGRSRHLHGNSNKPVVVPCLPHSVPRTASFIGLELACPAVWRFLVLMRVYEWVDVLMSTPSEVLAGSSEFAAIFLSSSDSCGGCGRWKMPTSPHAPLATPPVHHAVRTSTITVTIERHVFLREASPMPTPLITADRK